MSDVATVLHAMVRDETSRWMAIRSHDSGLALYPPRTLLPWRRHACDIVFGETMVQRLRAIARDDSALRQPGSLTYLEFVAAAIGCAYEQWLRAGEGAKALPVHLEARADGHVFTTLGTPLAARLRA